MILCISLFPSQMRLLVSLFGIRHLPGHHLIHICHLHLLPTTVAAVPAGAIRAFANWE